MRIVSPPALSGFCNPSNPPDSHRRCPKPNCPCECHEPPAVPFDPRVPLGLTVIYLRHGHEEFESGWSCHADAERFAHWLTDTGAAIDVEVVEL